MWHSFRSSPCHFIECSLLFNGLGWEPTCLPGKTSVNQIGDAKGCYFQHRSMVSIPILAPSSHCSKEAMPPETPLPICVSLVEETMQYKLSFLFYLNTAELEVDR